LKYLGYDKELIEDRLNLIVYGNGQRFILYYGLMKRIEFFGRKQLKLVENFYSKVLLRYN